MTIIKSIEDIHNAAICGIGYQAETIAQYISRVAGNKCIMLVDHFTQKPEDCYKIPSKRNSGRNSFSEVDMLMDSVVEDIQVKRFDMLSQEEKESWIFVYYIDDESISIFESIRESVGDNYFLITPEEVQRINDLIWDKDKIISNLWENNKFLYSEIHLLKNVLRRQLQSTVYDFHFEFHIVEHCNLKCAGCTHFSPLAREEFLDPLEFERDINRLAVLTGGNTRFINLLGGEPLLHPQICDFLKLCRKAFKNTIIRVVTNGIKLPDMPIEFWECCKNHSIIIGITQYPINVDYKEIIQKIETMGVSYESFSGDGYPRDEMWRLSLDAGALNRPIENFISCPRANACIFVSHGKVFNCATMANIYHYNRCFGTEFELCDDDFVDIYSIENAHEMFEKLCNPKPFCRFCNIGKRKYGVKWEKSKMLPEEWI